MPEPSITQTFPFRKRPLEHMVAQTLLTPNQAHPERHPSVAFPQSSNGKNLDVTSGTHFTEYLMPNGTNRACIALGPCHRNELLVAVIPALASTIM